MKFEAGNSKFQAMTKRESRSAFASFDHFRNSIFQFVSNFEFRISRFAPFQSSLSLDF